MNLQQITDDVMVRLGEAQTALVAAYMPGTNATTPVAGYTTSQVIGGWINDAQNDLARNYYPITDTVTYTWPAGQQFVKYTALTCSVAGNVAFGIRRMTFAGQSLVSAGRAATENWYPNLDIDARSQPQFYYEDSIDEIGVAPIPAVSSTVLMRVLVTPAPLTSSGDVPQFPADRHLLLSWYACAQALMKNTEDPTLASRGNGYMQAYLKGAQDSLSHLWTIDPDFAADLMPDKPGLPPSPVNALTR